MRAAWRASSEPTSSCARLIAAKIVGRKAALALERARGERIDVAERRCGRLARGDGGGQRFLRGDPAFALRRAGRCGEMLGLRRGAIEGCVAGMRRGDQRRQPARECRGNRPIVDRPHHRHARVDRFGRARLKRRVGAARRGAGGERKDRDEREVPHRVGTKGKMARPEGFEPPAPKFVVWCSIQLSYGRADAGLRQGRDIGGGFGPRNPRVAGHRSAQSVSR